MENMKEVLEYFKKKARNYDLVENQLYWNFSDELLWELIKKLVLDKLKDKKIKFMDAGGGTGRWSIKIINYLPKSKGVICDFCDEMLKVALEKIKLKGLENRLCISKCDIQNMEEENDNIYDFVINFHNVLGFTENPEKALSEIHRVTKKNGFIVSVVPNKYHALFFNIKSGRLTDINNIIKENRGKFVDDMPQINMFSPKIIRKLYENLGIKGIKIFGFPVTIYPDIGETKIIGNSIRIKCILENKKIYEKLLSLEKSLIFQEEAASRGNNIFAIGVK